MPRLEFTSPTKREAFARSNGICECHLIPWLNRPDGCGVKLGAGNTFYEHVVPDRIRQDNSLSNLACLCKTCWKEKTATYDLPLIAKSDRQQERDRGIKPQHYRPITGSKRSGIKVFLNGKRPVWRNSGREVLR